jgi:hypothetical protein
MRIIGYIEHPVLKITIFKMDNKFSVKLESGLYEQTYKFRQSDDINGPEDIRKIVDEAFIAGVLEMLDQMHRIKNKAIERGLPSSEDDEFEEII